MTAGISSKTRGVVALLLGLPASSFLLWCLGFPKFLAVTLVSLWALYLSLDRLLGRLAGWAIGRTPKAFIWTIECVCVRPSLCWRPHAWSEIIVTNWTWHNPPGFNVGGEAESELYILKIDRMTLRLELASIFRALRKHEAVQVDMLLLEGVHLKTQRNEEAALNLWEALDLPDSDVNVSAIIQNARRHGGMKCETVDRRRSMAAVKPLPPVSTEATRKAAKYTRPEWLRKATFSPRTTERREGATTRRFPCGCLPCFSSSASSTGPIPSQSARQYFEYPIGDPRRRPRWGVPMRFDIRQIAVVHVELWIFDLLTMDHRWRLLEPSDTKMAVSSLVISRDILEAGDERRAGGGLSGDSIRGVYLGELIWVLIGHLLPKVVESSPSSFLKTAAFVVGFAVRDSAVTACAKVLDCLIDTKHAVASRLAPWTPQGEVPPTPSGDCRVFVQLIRGRGIAHEGQRVNVFARLELRDPPFKDKVDTCDSMIRLWTKTPWWDQHFVLGPAGSVSSVVRITLFFRKTRHAGSTKCDGKIGEVVIPLHTLLVRDKVIDDKMVGWFPLEEPAHRRNTSGFKGRLKLGFKITNRDRLRDSESL